MKTILPVLIIPFILVLASCQKQESEIGSLNVSDLKSTPNIPVKLNFRANLSGDQEVPSTGDIGSWRGNFSVEQRWE